MQPRFPGESGDCFGRRQDHGSAGLAIDGQFQPDAGVRPTEARRRAVNRDRFEERCRNRGNLVPADTFDAASCRSPSVRMTPDRAGRPAKWNERPDLLRLRQAEIWLNVHVHATNSVRRLPLDLHRQRIEGTWLRTGWATGPEREGIPSISTSFPGGKRSRRCSERSRPNYLDFDRPGLSHAIVERDGD